MRGHGGVRQGHGSAERRTLRGEYLLLGEIPRERLRLARNRNAGENGVREENVLEGQGEKKY